VSARSRLAAVLPALALAFVTIRAARATLDDVDVGWLVAAGRWTLAAHAAPTRNAFSYAAPDHPWVMHEWLLGVIYAAGWRAVGAVFLNAIAVVAATALGGLVLHAARRTSALAAAAWTTALFVFSFNRLTSARPIGVMLVFPAIFVVLAFQRKLGSKRVIALVVLELVWTNLHGSFLLGVVILLAAWWEGRTRAHLAALVGAAAATLVNPYGLGLHRLVLRYALGRDPTLTEVHARVLEFAPVWRPSYHVLVSPLELGLLVFVAIAAVQRRHARGALALVLVAMALLQARNVALATIVGSILVFPPNVRDIVPRHPLRRPRRDASWLVLPAICAGLVALRAPAIDGSLGGPGFARLVAELPANANVFVPFRSSGLLLLLAGERGVRTFYDARNDCYPDDLARIGLALKDGELPPEGLATILRRFGTTAAIVPRADVVRATPGDARWPALAVLEPALVTFARVDEADGWRLLRATPSPREAPSASAPAP